jgi:hypothetical protein
LLSSDHQRITYNYKSTDRGWFGFGWGSVFETRLLVICESVPVNGVTRAALISQPAGSGASTQAVAHQWKGNELKINDKQSERQSPEMLLPWLQQE